MIVLWSDHGEMAGDHGRLHKSVFYESSVRVPLIIRVPGIEGGRVVPALVEIIDVYPTILEAVGAEPSRRCFGRSLMGLLKGEAESVRDEVLSEIHAFGCYNYMIRTERFKYAMNGEGEGFMLFDLEEDPDEQVNLIGHPEYGDVEREMRERLLRAIASSQCRYGRGGELVS